MMTKMRHNSKVKSSKSSRSFCQPEDGRNREIVLATKSRLPKEKVKKAKTSELKDGVKVLRKLIKKQTKCMKDKSRPNKSVPKGNSESIFEKNEEILSLFKSFVTNSLLNQGSRKSATSTMCENVIEIWENSGYSLDDLIDLRKQMEAETAFQNSLKKIINKTCLLYTSPSPRDS